MDTDRDRLLAFMEGLGLQNIEELSRKSATTLRLVGVVFADKIQENSKALIKERGRVRAMEELLGTAVRDGRCDR